MKILVVGSGGREHCLAWKLAQSKLVDKIYCAPGNGGTASIAENVDIAADDINQLLKFSLGKKIDLTVVGPEIPLVAGIVDEFQEAGLKIFGPSQALSFLEGSKIFAKELMRKYGIPTADFKVFSQPQDAKAYIKERNTPLVIKADGLAAGKGVFVTGGSQEALSAIDTIMVEKRFGASGEKVLIEECLQGEELSLLILSDGETIVPLASAQDHKRAFDNDRGPNTGGMGAYSPAPLVNESDLEKIIEKVFNPLINGLREQGTPYRGVLYAGLMIKDGQPMVLEFNVRFGDPEIQAILPRLKSDLAEAMLKTTEGKLSEVAFEWDRRCCLSVVLASGGYPGKYQKLKKISGLDGKNDVLIFHAGTKLVGSQQSTARSKTLVTNGGRVLNISALGDTIKEARQKAYRAIEGINFDDMYFRKDIGYRAL